MDWLGTWGVAMGAAWLSGVKLYGSVLTLGLLQHFGFAHLPGDLHVVGEWWVMAAAALLFVIEFVADKIPAVDSAWDAVHTFIPFSAGAVLAAAAFGHFDTRVRLLAFLLGGGIALTSHGAKAPARLAVNASPEPFSNVALSLLEDAGSVGLSLLAAFHPIVALAIVAVLVMFCIMLVRKLKAEFGACFGVRTPTSAVTVKGTCCSPIYAVRLFHTRVQKPKRDVVHKPWTVAYSSIVCKGMHGE